MFLSEVKSSIILVFRTTHNPFRSEYATVQSEQSFLKWLYTSIFVTPYLKQFCDHIEGSWQQSLENIRPG